MNAQQTQQKIAAALSREEPLSSKECDALLIDASAEGVSVGDRMSRVHPGDSLTAQGAEHRRASLSGEPEQLRVVLEEFETLKLEADQVRAMREELLTRRRQARTREAVEGLPVLHKSLLDKIIEAEAAHAALERAFDSVEDIYRQISQARAQCNIANVNPPGGASENTIARLARLGPLSNPDRKRVSMSRRSDIHFDNLGCAPDIRSRETA